MFISLLIAFIAGVLTVLAPCVLPLLPVIIGFTANKQKSQNVFLVTFSLGLSVFIFTLLLRTAIRFNPLLENIDDGFWRAISGIIILIFGAISLFPQLWDQVSLKFNLQRKSDSLLEKAKISDSPFAPVLLGLSLGPVFSSCSPTYFVIIGLLVAEGDFYKGLLLLVAYVVGLVLILLLVGLLGRVIVKNLKWASNPQGWFKKGFGILLILLGVAIIFGIDRQFETFLLDQGLYDNIQYFENQISNNGQSIVTQK